MPFMSVEEVDALIQRADETRRKVASVLFKEGDYYEILEDYCHEGCQVVAFNGDDVLVGLCSKQITIKRDDLPEPFRENPYRLDSVGFDEWPPFIKEALKPLAEWCLEQIKEDGLVGC